MSRITDVKCRQIEYEILGCLLENLTRNQIDRCIGPRGMVGFRGENNSSDEKYSDAVRTLFNVTKKRFDWSSIKVSDGSRQERPHPWPDPPDEITAQVDPSLLTKEEFQGDPLDLQFMKYARKVNTLILEQKSPTYKDSWRKRGLVGIYHNLGRKWDRIENVMEEYGRGRELDPECITLIGKAFVDALADLFAYSGKTLTYLEYIEMYRGVLKEWEKDNKLEDVS